jgi:hypothetical protein
VVRCLEARAARDPRVAWPAIAPPASSSGPIGVHCFRAPDHGSFVPTAASYAAAVYTLTESVGIDRPSADVWAILIDFANVPAWETDVLEVRQTSPGAPTLGTTFVARRLFGGLESLIDCRITAWQDGRAVTMELEGGAVRRASVTYAVEATGVDSCRVSYSIEGQMRTLLAWTTPFIPAIGRRLVRGNLANLARVAESAAIA